MPQAAVNLDVDPGGGALDGRGRRFLDGREPPASGGPADDRSAMRRARPARSSDARPAAIATEPHTRERSMTDRTLIKGGIVLTQDPALGELAGADVLIEDDKIAAVGQDLSADGARIIDATGDIVIPGFIDTHRHTWETSIRTCAPDFALITYFGGDPRQVRAALPARRRLRRQPVGLARVHQRGHHDARRLVAHHEHAGPRRRRRSAASRSRRSGRCSPTASATPRSWTGGSARTTRAAS